MAWPRFISERVDPWIFRLAANAGMIYGVTEVADAMPDVSDPTYMALGGLAALTAVAANRYVINPIARRFAGTAPERPVVGGIKTAVLAGLLAGGVVASADETAMVVDDLSDIVSSTIERITDDPVVDIKEVLEMNKTLGYEEDFALPDFTGVKLANKNSDIGRLQRAYRWKPAADVVEAKRKAPKGTLLAMAMHESYGNPLQPNGSNDGGIGLLHMQGPTAKSLGLRIYGDSSDSHDPKHGKSLKRMLQACEYKLPCVAGHDERGHPLKNLDAAARYMLQGKRNSSWDKGIKYYRGGRKKTQIGYLKKVKRLRDIVNDDDMLTKAKDDFNARNKGKFTWNQYIGAFHQYNGNFGTAKYAK